MKDTIEICIDCGEKYVKKHPSQKRCKECQRKHDKELHAEAGKRRGCPVKNCEKYKRRK